MHNVHPLYKFCCGSSDQSPFTLSFVFFPWWIRKIDPVDCAQHSIWSVGSKEGLRVQGQASMAPLFIFAPLGSKSKQQLDTLPNKG